MDVCVDTSATAGEVQPPAQHQLTLANVVSRPVLQHDPNPTLLSSPAEGELLRLRRVLQQP